MHVSYSAAQNAGNLSVVVVGWKDAQGQLVSVADSSNNSYTLAVGPTTRGLAVSQFIFYAANIAGASANANIITVTFSAPVNSPDIRILEYSGIDASRPIDVIKAAARNSMTSNSGLVTTTDINNLLVVATTVRTSTSGTASGFTGRLVTVPHGNLVQDRVVSATGSYRATAPMASRGAWVMQMVAFPSARSAAR